MNKQVLQLIAIVHDNYEHIEQLETLAKLLEDKYPEECIVAKTTQNSHYNYGLYTRDFKDAKLHIDEQITIDNEFYHATKRHGTPYEVAAFAWQLHLKNKEK